MKCECDNLPQFSYYQPRSELSRKLRPSLKFREKSKDKELHQCTVCGIYWRIDKNTFATDRFVWRLPEYRADWAEYTMESEEKKLLLASRKVATSQSCIWINCEKERLNGLVYCVDHAYERGIRS